MGTLDQLLGLGGVNVPANYGVPQVSSATVPGYGGQGPAGGSAGPYGAAGLAQQPFGGGPNTPLSNLAFPSGITPGGGGPLVGGPVQVRGNPALPFGGPSEAQGAVPNVPQGTSPGAPGAAPGVGNGQLTPFGPWNQPFVAPTAATEQNDPGYQFRLQQGMQALQNSAAAQGDLLSGNTLAGITQYGQNYASNEYQNVYNRQLQQYQQAYNIFQQNQANQFNRLAALSGLGQTAVGQLNSAGSTAAGQTGNLLLGAGGQIGQSLQNAAAASASGYVGAANAYGGALGNLGSLAGNLPLYSLLNQQSQQGNALDWASATAGALG